MSRRLSLGLDLGTSALKAVLLDEGGRVVAHVQRPLAISRPQVGWSEQNPHHWWTAACQAIDTLRAENAPLWQQVACIGLAGQMHGAVVLDAKDHPLRDAILHNDGRAARESQCLATSEPSITQITGSRPAAGFAAPKLLWMARHEAELFDSVDCVLSPKDYLQLRLTGRRVTDVSDAAGTLWFDIHHRCWSERLADATGLSFGQLPPVLESCEPTAPLLPEVAARFGLHPDVIVVAGAGDTPASGIGIGAIEPGEAFVNLSTSASMVVVVDRPVLDAAVSIHTLCHALPQRWYQMGAMLSGASCLRWITQATRLPDESAMLSLLEQRMPRTPQGLQRAQQAPVFLPYLSGERTPHNDVNASGVFFGLAHDTDAAQLGYAVVEGVCFGLRDAMAAIESTGTQVGTCTLVGGGARSPYWADLLASALRKPIQRVEGSELGAAMGAARLGWLAHGRTVETVCPPAKVLSLHLPQTPQARMLDARYHQFRELYRALAPLFPVRMQALEAAPAVSMDTHAAHVLN